MLDDIPQLPNFCGRIGALHGQRVMANSLHAVTKLLRAAKPSRASGQDLRRQISPVSRCRFHTAQPD